MNETDDIEECEDCGLCVCKGCRVNDDDIVLCFDCKTEDETIRELDK
jgi:hypothetical protein